VSEVSFEALVVTFRLIGTTYQIVLPSDRVERHRSHFRDEEVHQPVHATGNRRRLCPYSQRRDLSGVHKWNQEQPNRECRKRKEVEDQRGSSGGGIILVRLQTGQTSVCYRHQCRTADEKTTASDAIDEEDGAGSSEELPGL
jgi:hypothetical protein